MKQCGVCTHLANSPYARWENGQIVEMCQDPCHFPYTQGVKPLYHAIVPTMVYPFEGHIWMELDCLNYDAWTRLPAAVEYEGRVYTRKGWNSDYGKCYYRSVLPTD